MTTQTVSSYDFSEDAMGLGDFIAAQMSRCDDESANPVVYVEDGDARKAYRADWIEETLTDGSKVYNLRLWFTED